MLVKDLITPMSNLPETGMSPQESRWHIEALLDKPSIDTMGMRALLISDPARELYEVTGINRSPLTEQSFQEHELRYLIGSGAVRSGIVLELEEIDSPNYMASIPRMHWSGLYVGNNFSHKAQAHGLSAEPLMTNTSAITVPDGTLELGATDAIYQHIDTWLSRALKQAAETPDDEIALLMTRCDATSVKSQIARWLAAPDQITRNQELDFILRLSRDNHWDLATDRAGLNKTLRANFSYAISK